MIIITAFFAISQYFQAISQQPPFKIVNSGPNPYSNPVILHSDPVKEREAFKAEQRESDRVSQITAKLVEKARKLLISGNENGAKTFYQMAANLRRTTDTWYADKIEIESNFVTGNFKRVISIANREKNYNGTPNMMILISDCELGDINGALFLLNVTSSYQGSRYVNFQYELPNYNNSTKAGIEATGYLYLSYIDFGGNWNPSWLVKANKLVPHNLLIEYALGNQYLYKNQFKNALPYYEDIDRQLRGKCLDLQDPLYSHLDYSSTCKAKIAAGK